MSRVARSKTMRGLGLTVILALTFILVLANGGSVVFADVFSWIQDTQADFQSDTLTNTDAVTEPGSVLLERADTLSVGGVSGWRYRRQAFVDNNVADVLPAGYSVKLVLDTASLVGEGKLRADGNDLRVVWDDGGTLVELDRAAETAFNAPDTEIWFKTQDPIPGNGSDGNYYIYYGNPSAGAPPADRGQVYAMWDDFEGSSLDARWNDSGSVFLSGGVAYLASDSYIIDTTAYTYGVLETRLRMGQDDDKAWWGWEAAPLNADDMVVFQEYPPSTRDFTGLTRDDQGPYHREALPEPTPGGLTDWHVYTADWWPGNARWLIDGVVGASTSAEVPNSAIYALFSARFVPLQIDWIKLRLRVAEEPTVSLGTPQSEYVNQGQVLSIVYDTNRFSDWKDLTWDATTPPDTGISLRLRTGATQDDLSTAPWVDYDQSGLPISNDPGRWVQYEATLTTTNPLTTPQLHKVTISYEDMPVTLSIVPDESSVFPGGVAAYTALVDDGNQTWDVTAETDFSIEAGAGGSWLDNLYTSENAGDWTVTGEYADLTATGVLHVVLEADLSVSKTSSASEVSVGEPLTYTVIVTNNGPSMVQGVTVTDTLPGDVVFDSATPSQGSGCSGTSTLVCPLGVLNDGAAATVTIVVAPAATGTIENTAEAAGTDSLDNPVSASDSVPVTVIPSAADPEIKIAKLPDVQTVRSGSAVNFTIVVTNTGGSMLTQVSVIDALPSADDCNRSLGSLPSGESVSYNCTVDGGDVTADFINRVTVAGITPVAGRVTAVDTALVHVETGPAPSDFEIYLPLIMNSYGTSTPEPTPEPTPGPGPAPDLVVEQLNVGSNGVQVVIKNQGNAPIPTTDVFWVDLYIDPDPVPTGVNQTWDDGRCAEGMVWGISAPALPLGPGDTVTLTNGDAFYWPEYSNFSGAIQAGSAVYAQVDSANVNTAHGGVLESHEIAGGPYNNISGPVYVSSTLNWGTSETEPSVMDNDRRARARSMPPRP